MVEGWYIESWRVERFIHGFKFLWDLVYQHRREQNKDIDLTCGKQAERCLCKLVANWENHK